MQEKCPVNTVMRVMEAPLPSIQIEILVFRQALLQAISGA